MTAAVAEQVDAKPVPKKKKRAPTKRTESKDSEPKSVNLFEELAKKAPPPPGPYPEGIEVWEYQPEDEKLAPILLPLNGFKPGNKLWYFDLAQLPILQQTWKWMDQANVPKGIQRQCQFLEDREYFSMFTQWFNAMKAKVAPKDSVTPGK